MRGMKLGKRIAACLLAFAMTAGMLAGCGGGGGTETDGSDGSGTDAASGKEEQAQDGGQENGMGRYVEKTADLGGSSLTDWNGRVFSMADGSLLLSDNSGFVLRSLDNGASWSKEDLPWLTKMKEENKYIYTMAFGADQTAAVIWTESEEGSGDSGDGVQLKMDFQLTLVKSDGTEVPAEVKLEAEDGFLNFVSISDQGRIIVSTLGSNLYEVKTDGSMEKFLNISEGSPSLLCFQGDLMLMDGWGWDTPLIYNMEEKVYIEDEVLTAFVKENYEKRESMPGKSYDMFLALGDDGAIYLAGQTGVYRHVIGGSVMEQVLDGRLSVLGNPAYRVRDMLVADNNEFVVLLTGEKITRLVYDPNVPSRPDEKLVVWSLENEEVIRQAISKYQKDNPSVYVEYEVGLQGNSMTREDAIKNLNTRTMAGKGPDVIVLDNLPIDSYIEKGILMDIAPLLDGLGGDEAVFPNIVDAFRNDGHVYAVPGRIQVPYICGKNSDLEKMTGMSEIADEMERMRENDPDAYLLGLPSAKGIMRIFSMACAPAWKTAEGALDAEAVSEFLTQAKRMYDVQLNGLPEECMEEWESEKTYYQQYESPDGSALEDADEMRVRHEATLMLGGKRQFVAGAMEDIWEYNVQLSVAKMEGFSDYVSAPMDGQCSGVFWARTLMGINASSESAGQAQDFVKAALGKEIQTEIVEGFPVTRKALLDIYADQWVVYKDNDYVSGQGGTYDLDGQEINMLIRVPDEKEVNALAEWIGSLNTAYVEDKTFESVVYEEGRAYVQGDKTLEEVMGAIETRLGIYLAE